MPLRTYQDASGASIRRMEVNGLLYPYVEGIDQDRCVQQLPDAEMRDDDVLLANYPKSGTHWLWEIISMIHNGNAETIPEIKQSRFLEALAPEALASLPSPRILNTHMRFKDLPVQMFAKKTKIVLSFRNPKDIAVSLYNHEYNLYGRFGYEGRWTDWLQSFFLKGLVTGGDWFEETLRWEAVMKDNPDYPIHVVFYEDLKENYTQEVERLAKFLGSPLTSDMCHQIAEKCSFSNMRVDKVGLENEYWTKVWRNEKPGIYRKGEVGDWKNWFTVAQNEQFDRIMKEKIAGSNLKFRYEL